MKKDKITAVIVFLTVIFIVFVFGLFIGKKLSPESSKEGTINKPVIKNNNNIRTKAPRRLGHRLPSAGSNIKFAPISRLAALKKGEVLKKRKTGEKGQKVKHSGHPVKQKEKTKIIYVKKPVYVYRYIIKKVHPASSSKANLLNFKVYYTIQVAALSNYAQAKAIADKLNSMGFFAYIIPITVSGKSGKAVYQQVRVGKFSTEKGAKSLENVIAKKFKVKPYIIKVD